MKKINVFFIVCALIAPVSAQEPDTDVSEAVRVAEWNEFQRTQEELVEGQVRLFGEIGQIRQSVRQINLNLLSWQEATQNAAAAGKDVHCDAFKTKYDPKVEGAVIGLAVIGVLLLLNNFLSLFKRKPKTEPVSG